MDKPFVNTDNTMENLYRIKECLSSRRINMTTDELITDIKEEAREGYEILERLRLEKAKAI